MKKHFYSRLQDRVDRLRRYKNQPYSLSIKLIWWIIKCCLTPSHWKGSDPEKRSVIYSKPESKNIGILLKGGIGDITIGGILIKKLHEILPSDYKFSLLLTNGVEIYSILYRGQSFINQILRDDSVRYEEFDIVIELDVYFPKIIYKNPNINIKNNFLNRYIEVVNNFHKDFPNITRTDRVPDQMMLIEILNKNRISCLDIDNLLGITKNCIWDITVDDSLCSSIYSKWPELQKPFITVGRSVDTSNEYSDSIRLWSVEKYNAWIKIFKAHFPDVTVVQLGGVKKRCEQLNVDLNLVGETTFDELLFILKNSSLHLDGECGYVHLRHFLTKAKGLNIVLFGPTSISIKSYPENINVRSKNSCCLKYCEWISGSSWQARCIKNGSCRAHCIEAITPEYLYSQAEPQINKTLRTADKLK